MLLVKIKDCVKFVIAFILAKFLKVFPQKRDIWVITERKDECKDNGFYLFKYIRFNYPHLPVYYAIEKKSLQRNRISSLGNVIAFNSLKHYVYALAASRLVGAFNPPGIPESFCFYKFTQFVKGKKCFLQHGIIKETIPFLFYNETPFDLFICGAKCEYDFILNTFEYPLENVKYTGLCRFDGLLHYETSKQVLVMLTWRKWIPSATWGKNYNPEKYEYFKSYRELLDDEDLNAFVAKFGYKIVLYLHHELQPYLFYFKEVCERRNIVIAVDKDYDVQDLLKNSACLITDYSSVAFDFAYMKKPLIYYQFDEAVYYENHYQKGYFDYETMGFGPKCVNLNAVRNSLERIISNNALMDDVYQKRVDDFFTYRDEKNCERVFHEINNL